MREFSKEDSLCGKAILYFGTSICDPFLSNHDEAKWLLLDSY